MPNIKIPDELKDRLDKMKIIDREPYYEVIERVLKFWDDNHADKR